MSFTNNISLAQATDRTSFRMSYTNTDLKGYMPNSSLVKNIFNASGSVKSADKKLEAFTNITYLNTHAKGRSETGYGDNNVMLQPDCRCQDHEGVDDGHHHRHMGQCAIQ